MSRSIRFTVLGVALVAVTSGALVYHNRSSSSSANNDWVAAATEKVRQSETATSSGNGSNSAGIGAVPIPSGGESHTSSSSSSKGNVHPSTTTKSTRSGTGSVAGAQTTAPVTKGASGGTQPAVISTKAAPTTNSKSSNAGTHDKSVSSTPSTGAHSNGGHQGSGATQPSGSNSGTFTISLSEDNGQTKLEEKTIPIVPGESLMQYMHQTFTVQTTEGDAFIIGINGIMSQWTGVPVSQRQPVDWFLYVNGTQAPVGASSIYPHAGDVDLWDYHRWNPSGGN